MLFTRGLPVGAGRPYTPGGGQSLEGRGAAAAAARHAAGVDPLRGRARRDKGATEVRCDACGGGVAARVGFRARPHNTGRCLLLQDSVSFRLLLDG